MTFGPLLGQKPTLSPRSMFTLATTRVMEQFNEAVTFAQSHEIPWPRDPTADLARWGVHHDDPPPFNRLRGPVHPRGGVSGVIRVHGEEVTAWGEPDRVDQTFKGAIATAAGKRLRHYKTEDVAQRCMALTSGRGVDRIIEMDLAANIQSDLAALRADGEIVVYGSGAPEIAVPFFASILKNARYYFFIVYNLSAADRASALAGVTSLLRENKLKHQIAARLPLSKAAEAHRLVESGAAVGNVVLDIS